jgi:hypothetical protein
MYVYEITLLVTVGSVITFVEDVIMVFAFGSVVVVVVVVSIGNPGNTSIISEADVDITSSST